MVHFVIVGGSFAAVGALKTIASVVPDARVTVVSASTHAFFNVAAPRLVVRPELVDETLFDIEETVAKYGGKDATFVHGEAVRADIAGGSITVKKDGGAGAGGEVDIGFDYLVLATGARAATDAFKGGRTPAEVRERVNAVARATRRAKKIVVVGGGATGVELAGELGEHYGKDKDIVLYTGDARPLMLLGAARAAQAQKKLENLNVRLVNDVWLDSAVETADGGYELKFKNGTTESADCYINATGVLPNTGYLDPRFLDARGRVRVDENLHLQGHTNVYALGDIVSGGNATIVDFAYTQQPSFESAVKHDVIDPAAPYKPYKLDPKVTIVAPISSKGGMGVLYNWGVPNFLVRMLKAKDFMISKGKDYFT